MNYSQSLHYLNSFFNLERISEIPHNSFWNLKRMEYLLKISGNPQKNFFPILIAGTVGKGSTGFFLESILKESKIKAGFYNSPHILDPKERIRIGGRNVSEKAWVEGLSYIKTILKKKPLPKNLGNLTYFEIMTFLAIWTFKETNVKIGIFEIGMGGRLDATNVLDAKLSIFTPIHFDHESFLGNTLEKIAKEKAEIIKRNAKVISSPQNKKVVDIINVYAKKKKAEIIFASPVNKKILELDGDFQKMNAGVSIKAACILREDFGFSISKENSFKALRKGNWFGRWEKIKGGRNDFILDGAHNPLSIKILAKEVKKSLKNKKRWLVFGAMRDKKSGEMLKILSSAFDKVILTEAFCLRSRKTEELIDEAKKYFKLIFLTKSIKDALELFSNRANYKETAVITGSFYLVGEAKEILNRGNHA